MITEQSSGLTNLQGFGFITQQDSGKNVFVHQSAIAGTGFRTLPEAQQVTFDAEEGEKGPAARTV